MSDDASIHLTKAYLVILREPTLSVSKPTAAPKPTQKARDLSNEEGLVGLVSNTCFRSSIGWVATEGALTAVKSEVGNNQTFVALPASDGAYDVLVEDIQETISSFRAALGRGLLDDIYGLLPRLYLASNLVEDRLQKPLLAYIDEICRSLDECRAQGDKRLLTAERKVLNNAISRILSGNDLAPIERKNYWDDEDTVGLDPGPKPTGVGTDVAEWAIKNLLCSRKDLLVRFKREKDVSFAEIRERLLGKFIEAGYCVAAAHPQCVYVDLHKRSGEEERRLLFQWETVEEVLKTLTRDEFLVGLREEPEATEEEEDAPDDTPRSKRGRRSSGDGRPDRRL